MIPTAGTAEFREDAIDTDTGRVFPALRITSSDLAHSDRVIAHIVYELARQLAANPEQSNADLLASVDWILQVLGREPGVMSDVTQHGLIAECMLLKRLLSQARTQGVSATEVLGKWWGPTGGKRDFVGTGIAVEVKSTTHNVRLHHIASLDQLVPLAPGETVFLYSVGLKTEPTSPKSLPVHIAEVDAELVKADGGRDELAADTFSQILSTAGYDSSHEHIYATQPGVMPNPALPPRLFDVSHMDVLSLASFKNDRLPKMVRAVSYQLEVLSDPLDSLSSKEALGRLITSVPLGAAE